MKKVSKYFACAAYQFENQLYMYRSTVKKCLVPKYRCTSTLPTIFLTPSRTYNAQKLEAAISSCSKMPPFTALLVCTVPTAPYRTCTGTCTKLLAKNVGNVHSQCFQRRIAPGPTDSQALHPAHPWCPPTPRSVGTSEDELRRPSPHQAPPRRWRTMRILQRIPRRRETWTGPPASRGCWYLYHRSHISRRRNEQCPLPS